MWGCMLYQPLWVAQLGNHHNVESVHSYDFPGAVIGARWELLTYLTPTELRL